MTDLKPCPFCGPVARLDFEDRALVTCSNDNCPGSPMTVWCATDDEAIALWNTRASHADCDNKSEDGNA